MLSFSFDTAAFNLLQYFAVLDFKIHLFGAYKSLGCHCSSLRALVARIKARGAISQTNSPSTLLEEAETWSRS